ncbi:MAG: hypothetical protein KDC61_16385, partial [Saprospiraceae bacterium]|nr:hypothetical protein [Saprospiraceae bacterium]
MLSRRVGALLRRFVPSGLITWGLLAGIFVPFTLDAQSTEAASSTAQSFVLDTTPLLFTFALTPERAYPADDTLPNRHFRMYDPARRQQIDWGTLGNLGSAARPLLFESQ